MRIIDRARRHLAEVGVSQSTYDSLASSIGCSRGAILHHFPAKTDLLHAVLVHGAADTAAQMEKVAGELRAVPPRDRLEAALDRVWRVFRGHSARVTMELLVAARTDSGLLPAARRARSSLDAAWRGVGAALGAQPQTTELALTGWSMICERLAVEPCQALPAEASIRRMMSALARSCTPDPCLLRPSHSPVAPFVEESEHVR
ncbi:MAG: TetR/AcrR family transcriptional regulator [Steroidobacteraceae bacterium]|jgi:AcrR family transcriptional regulator|nr:TetR/AcrR family transcriptional regulator [Steroidobacteraceae bacterium]